MKVLINSSLVLAMAILFTACASSSSISKHSEHEDASFMLMDKKNEHSHYKWMMEGWVLLFLAPSLKGLG